MTIESSVPTRDHERSPNSPPRKLRTDEMPKETVSQVAKDILRQRLRRVFDSVRPAVDLWKDDPEHVHRLRVATRRASAATRAFARLLPQKRTKHLKKVLSKLRRAAGEARDLDVLQMRLNSQPPQLSPKVIRKAEKMIADRRAQAQAKLAKAPARLEDFGFSQRVAQLLERVHWRGEEAEPSFRDAFNEMLRRELDEFAAAIGGEFRSPDEIHQLRIHTKQLRYTLDLDLEGSREIQPLHREIKRLQNRLGELNDHVVAGRIFLEWHGTTDSPKRRKVLKKLARDRWRMLRKKTKEFRQWWPKEQSTLRELLDELATNR